MEEVIALDSIGARKQQFPNSAFDIPVNIATHATIVWGLDSSNGVFSSDILGCHRHYPLPEGVVAKDLSLDPRGVPWVLARRRDDDTPLLAEFRRSQSSWVLRALEFECRSIAVTATGAQWVVDGTGQVWHIDANGDRSLHSEEGVDFARQIAYREGHRIWAIGAQERFGGYVVYNRSEETGDWFELPAPASASQLSIGPDGVAWSVNANGEIWRLHPNGGGSFRECQVFTGCIKCRFGTRDEFGSNTACGPDGVIWAIKRSGDERRVMHLGDAVSKSFAQVPLPFEVAMLAGSSS